MIFLFKFGACLALAATVMAVQPPILNGVAENNYDVHKDHIYWNYQGDFPPVEERKPTDSYSHYRGGNPKAAAQLYAISLKHPYGPAHITYGRDEAYVTTKLPHTHPLANSWGLGFKQIDDNGQVQRKELYAFWRLKKGKVMPELLRLDLWPAGSLVTHTVHWGAIF